MEKNFENVAIIIEDLDLSSMEIMTIVSKIEKEFGMKFTESQILSIERVEDFLNYL